MLRHDPSLERLRLTFNDLIDQMQAEKARNDRQDRRLDEIEQRLDQVAEQAEQGSVAASLCRQYRSIWDRCEQEDREWDWIPSRYSNGGDANCNFNDGDANCDSEF